MKIKGGDKGWSHQPVWADADKYLEELAAEQEFEVTFGMRARARAAAPSAQGLCTHFPTRRDGRARGAGRDVEVRRVGPCLCPRRRAPPPPPSLTAARCGRGRRSQALEKEQKKDRDKAELKAAVAAAAAADSAPDAMQQLEAAAG